jgi:type I restriction enzyme R subunit
MVSTPSEYGVERSLLSWLDGVGWETHGQDGDRGANVLNEAYERDSHEVIYWNLLAEQVVALNEDVTEDNVDKFVSSLRRDLDAENLMDGNREFHQLLTKGKTFSVQRDDGTTETVYVDLIDYETPANNRFHAVNQFSISRGGTTIRPDVNLFVNGIPLVTMELKSLAQDNDYYDAVRDLQDYEERLSRLFVPGLFNVAADTMEFRYGAVGAPMEYYQLWRPEDYDPEGNDMEQAVRSLCTPRTILDLLKHFVFYETAAGGDKKIIPRYMQYHAVNEMLDRVSTGVHNRGLVWHTQGSGKSFTMLYAAQNLLNRSVMDAPQVFIIVDTDKLNSQMRDQLANLSLGHWTEAESIAHLQELIENGRSELVLTTIQKFEDVDPDVQGNDEVVVMSDEAHRFMEADLGSRLDAALPDCYHFGFTGTPVKEGDKEKDRNTFREFSPEGEEYLHYYSIKNGIEDGLILPVYFTLRHQLDWNVDEAHIDAEFEDAVAGLSAEEKREFLRKNVTTTTMAELGPRVDKIVDEIDGHYDQNVAPNGWKGMVVTPSRRSAAMYGERLVDRRGEDSVEVLYTARKGDSELISQFHTDSEERDNIIKRFKKEDAPELLVVHNMLLTGFDAPVLKTIYLDRNLRDHTLMQAIARTNRPADGKENGEIVDFQGVFENIDDALDYDAETRAFAAQDKSELYEKLKNETERMLDLFDGIPQADTQEAVSAAIERVSTHPERRKFKQGFRRLQDLYESVAPDGRLVREGIQDKYKWLSRVHVAVQRTASGKERPEEEMREKTRDILNEHIDVGEIRRDFPTYKLGEEYLDDIEGLDNPGVAASQIAHATREHLRPRTGQNPRYERLSERVNDIVERWQGGELSDPDAVEALKAVEEDVMEVDDAAGENNMEAAKYALRVHLLEEESETIESESQAQRVADEIVTAFDQRVDRDYPGWETNQPTVNEIQLILLDVLVKKHELGVLVQDDDFADSARRYLIENYA